MVFCDVSAIFQPYYCMRKFSNSEMYVEIFNFCIIIYPVYSYETKLCMLFELQNRERSRSVRPSKPPPPLSETDESEDELAEGDDYIKMMQPKGSVQRARENSKKGTSVVQFENSAMYLAMS